MKSKTSYFNKTIFLKNVTLYWPIWGIYTFILMCAMPFVLWLEYNDGYRITPLTSEQKFSRLCDALELLPFHVILTAGVAVLIGMAVFSYLYNSKSANMIHSLPVNRTELFGTNVLTGWAFLAVPQVAVFIITVLLCLSEDVTQIEYLGMWLLVMLATDFIAFAFVAACAMFTGQLFALPIYVIVINCLAYVVNLMLQLVVFSFAYGVSDQDFINETLLIWLSPIICYVSKVRITEVYQYSELLNEVTLVKMELEGLHCIVIYFIVAIALYAVAYAVYQKRHIEHAGDLITVGFVKPIFRCGVGAIGALYGSMLIRAIFLGAGIYINWFVYVLLLLFIGAICYFIADMFVRKTFRVFKKQNWVRCGMFSVLLLLSFGGMYVYAEASQYRVPETEEIKCAFVDMGYRTKFEGEKLQLVTDIHKKIINNLDYYEELDQADYYWNSDLDYEYLNIYYVMKDGETFYRSYRIPMEDDGQEIVETIYAIEQEPETFLKNVFCYDYEGITQFTDGWFDFQGISMDGNVNYYSEDVTNEQMKILYKAVIADALDGKLTKYNGHYSADMEKYDDELMMVTYNISFDYTVPDTEENYDYWDYVDKYEGNQEIAYDYMDEYYEVMEYANISFGKDCTNIIKAIEECGLIKEGLSIYWGDEK